MEWERDRPTDRERGRNRDGEGERGRQGERDKKGKGESWRGTEIERGRERSLMHVTKRARRHAATDASAILGHPRACRV